MRREPLWRFSWLLAALFALSVLGLLQPQVALAAEVQMQLSTRSVGVGEKIRVQAVVEPADGEPRVSSPKIRVTRGARVQGPSFGPRQEMRLDMNGLVTKTSYIATWIVSPTQPGKLVIGPVTFEQGGKTLSGQQVSIDVTAQPQPQQRSARRRSPFGFDFDFDFPQMRRRPTQMAQAPSDLKASQARDPYAFIEARLDAKEIVVGQPVKLTVIAYGSQGDFAEAVTQDPTFPDFASYLLLANSEEEPPYVQELGDSQFVVRKIREYILVPLRAGTLTISSMEAVIQGRRQRRYPARGHTHGVAVKSAPLSVEVKEPPEAGRPPGYLPGDVGRYKLQAQVSPPKLKQGEYAEVLVTISGEGQLPSAVQLPEGPDVAWEPPTIKGGPEVIEGLLQGRRSLKYALQVKGEGVIDLGEIVLPYYDHRARRYRTASAKLGTIEATPQAVVSPQPQAAALAPKPEPTAPAAAGFEPRVQAEPTARRESWAVPGWSWWALLLAPFVLFASVVVPQFVGKRLRRRSSEEKDETKSLLREAQRIFDEEPQKGTAAFEKALFEAIRVATGVNARGLLRSEIARELGKAGLDSGLALQVQELLLEFESARYGSGETDSASFPRRVQDVIKRLPKARAKKKGGNS